MLRGVTLASGERTPVETGREVPMAEPGTAATGEHHERELRAADGTVLFAQTWSPDGAPDGLVCLVHGLGEHSGRYGHVYDALVGAGYAVAAIDLRGHGRSQGRRGHTPIAETMDDIGLLLADTRQRFGPGPVFLYGHSLGGLLVITYTMRRAAGLAGVVASAPPLRTPLRDQRAKVLAADVLGRLLPGLTLPSGLDDSLISRDPEVVAAYRADPLCHSRASLGCARGSFAAVDWALAHAGSFPVPLLILHGGADRIAYPGGSEEFAGKVPGDCTVKIYEGLYHETHNEPERQRVLTDLTRWLGARTARATRKDAGTAEE